jgi:hypothetical protein
MYILIFCAGQCSSSILKQKLFNTVDTKPPELPVGGAGETYKADGFELSGDIDDGECKLPAKENDEVEATKGLKSPGRHKRVKPS